MFVSYNACKRDISFGIFMKYPRVRWLLTINWGNVMNASSLISQWLSWSHCSETNIPDCSVFVAAHWPPETIIAVTVSGVLLLILIVVIGVWFIARSRFKKIPDRPDFTSINPDYERKILISVSLGFETKITNQMYKIFLHAPEEYEICFINLKCIHWDIILFIKKKKQIKTLFFNENVQCESYFLIY